MLGIDRVPWNVVGMGRDVCVVWVQVYKSYLNIAHSRVGESRLYFFDRHVTSYRDAKMYRPP